MMTLEEWPRILGEITIVYVEIKNGKWVSYICILDKATTTKSMIRRNLKIHFLLSLEKIDKMII